MCGRFQMTEETFSAIARMAHIPSFEEIPLGMIYPSQKSLVLYDDHGTIKGGLAVFGYPWKTRKGRLLNARAETVLDKPMFRLGMERYRVVIPASCFYEWNVHKTMVAFSEPRSPVLYMAGFMMEDSFVILTTRANASVQDIHHRMPVILRPDQVRLWLCDRRMTEPLLQGCDPLLDSVPGENKNI